MEAVRVEREHLLMKLHPLLKVPVEQFNELAQKGTHLYDISGRCGVYAKTDIQPLLNQEQPRKTLRYPHSMRSRNRRSEVGTGIGD